MYKAILINLLYISCILHNYKIKFGYSQVLFMGSVPRINRPLAIVSWAYSSLFEFFMIHLF